MKERKRERKKQQLTSNEGLPPPFARTINGEMTLARLLLPPLLLSSFPPFLPYAHQPYVFHCSKHSFWTSLEYATIHDGIVYLSIGYFEFDYIRP